MASLVLRIPESIVVKDSSGVEADDEDWDLTRDVEDESQNDDSHNNANKNEDEVQSDDDGDIAKHSESEGAEDIADEEPQLTWVPEDGVNLQKLASEETLVELRALTGCRLQLDGANSRILIFSKDDHRVNATLEKLNVLQEEFVSKHLQ